MRFNMYEVSKGLRRQWGKDKMGVTPYVNFHLRYRSYLLWAILRLGSILYWNMFSMWLLQEQFYYFICINGKVKNISPLEQWTILFFVWFRQDNSNVFPKLSNQNWNTMKKGEQKGCVNFLGFLTQADSKNATKNRKLWWPMES